MHHTALSDFINRILEAKVKLTQCGYLDLQDDIHLLERLKTGIKSNVKYAQLAMTLQCMPNVRGAQTYTRKESVLVTTLYT